MCTCNTSQVRRMLGQVIIAMAHHHYLSLEGGHLMVEFVVRQCALNIEDKVSQTEFVAATSHCPVKNHCNVLD